MRKFLKEDLVIPACIFITDDPNLQPVTPIQKALDDYLKLLPSDYFCEAEEIKGGYGR